MFPCCRILNSSAGSWLCSALLKQRCLLGCERSRAAVNLKNVCITPVFRNRSPIVYAKVLDKFRLIYVRSDGCQCNISIRKPQKHAKTALWSAFQSSGETFLHWNSGPVKGEADACFIDNWVAPKNSNWAHSEWQLAGILRENLIERFFLNLKTASNTIPNVQYVVPSFVPTAGGPPWEVNHIMVHLPMHAAIPRLHQRNATLWI
jgi:hypothetical protein